MIRITHTRAFFIGFKALTQIPKRLCHEIIDNKKNAIDKRTDLIRNSNAKPGSNFTEMITMLGENEWTKSLEILERSRSMDSDNLIIYEETVSRCAKAGKWRTTLDVLEEMTVKYPLTQKVLEMALVCCAKGSQQAPLAAYNIFQYMVSHKIPRRLDSYALLYQALTDSNEFEKCNELWDQILLDKIRISTALYAARIESLAASGVKEQAENFLKESLRKKSRPYVFYLALLKGLLRSGASSDADKVLGRMLAKSIVPKHILIAQLLVQLITYNGDEGVQMAVSRLQSLASNGQNDTSTMSHQNMKDILEVTSTSASSNISNVIGINNGKKKPLSNSLFHKTMIDSTNKIILSTTINHGTRSGSPTIGQSTPTVHLTLSVWIQVLQSLVRTGGGHWDAINAVLSLAENCNVPLRTSDWVPALIHELGDVMYWSYVFELQSRLPADISVEEAILTCLVHNGLAATALTRHKRLLVPDAVTTLQGEDEVVELEAASPPRCGFSMELSQALLVALCEVDDWEAVDELLIQLCTYEGVGEKVYAIEQLLPGLFTKAIQMSQDTSGGHSQVSNLLLLMREYSIPLTWSGYRVAVRVLLEECRWSEILSLFASRKGIIGYQPCHAPTYIAVIFSAISMEADQKAVRILMDYITELEDYIIRTSSSTRDGIRSSSSKGDLSRVGGTTSNAGNKEPSASTSTSRQEGKFIEDVDLSAKDSLSSRSGSRSTSNIGNSKVKTRSTTPSAKPFGMVISMLIRQRQYSEARQLVEQLSRLGIVPTRGAMTGVIKDSPPGVRAVMVRELMRAGMVVADYKRKTNGTKKALQKRRRKGQRIAQQAKSTVSSTSSTPKDNTITETISEH